MEINVYDHQHQTNLVQYDKLHVHVEDKLIDSYFQMNVLVYYDVNKLLKQELLNFLIKLDKNELQIMIHNRKQFELDQMHTKNNLEYKIFF
jgi:hypothetical protein